MHVKRQEPADEGSVYWMISCCVQGLQTFWSLWAVCVGQTDHFSSSLIISFVFSPMIKLSVLLPSLWPSGTWTHHQVKPVDCSWRAGALQLLDVNQDSMISAVFGCVLLWKLPLADAQKHTNCLWCFRKLKNESLMNSVSQVPVIWLGQNFRKRSLSLSFVAAVVH